ncbi:hypothetical protein Igag_0785 [Ignisphaera aggregans DSM 17230]|uniref:Uncharacterized protein n=1 Tax=Ignisphaera aggregans (strain DSM 17230 / JCM 13409 / AQ1.S1) TaxID=583356 RepID=E0STD4_IGNAA|nr:hypothetical protein Igag_0785 [Ignisphaera aggregans DSM 17230]
MRLEFSKINLFIDPNASGKKSNLAKTLRLFKNHFIYGIPIPEESIVDEIPFWGLVHRFNVYEDIDILKSKVLKRFEEEIVRGVGDAKHMGIVFVERSIGHGFLQICVRKELRI